MHKYTLTRTSDSFKPLVKHAKSIKWIMWNADGTFQRTVENIELNCSIILDPNSLGGHSWMTTEVTEIISKSETLIVFKTKNSTYELSIANEVV